MTALISTIASTTTQSSLEAAAQEVCSSLVTHYSDAVHQKQSAGNGEVEHPYFHDDGYSSLPCLPPVCEFWQRKLLEVDDSNELKCGGAKTADKDISLAVTHELLYCYETMIRPMLTTDSDASVGAAAKIIEHYELLLAHCTQHHNIEEKTATLDGVVKRLNKVHIRDDDKKYDDDNSDTIKIGSIIHIISQDISVWTTKITHHDVQTTTKKIQSCLVPYLLRLLEHTVALLLSSFCINDDNIDKTDVAAFKEALAIATVICVPFVGDGKSSNSGNFDIGTLMGWIYESNIDGKSNCNQFSITTALKCCSPTPLSVMDNSDLMLSSSFMMRPVVDLSAPSARFVAPWSDGVAFMTATRLLKEIYTSSLLVAPSQDKEFAGKRDIPDNIRSLLQTIGDNVGIEVLSSTVRAFFYGRLTHPASSSSSSNSDVSAVASKASGPYMPMIRRIGTEKRVKDTTTSCTNSADDLSKERKKLQLSAASLILCTILPQQSSFTAHDDAISDVIPIALTLLDDTQPFHQALGAVIFLSAIESMSTTTESNVPSFVAKFNHFLTSTFETSIKQCGREDASLITIICYAQSKWIEYLSSSSQRPDCIVPQATVNALARKAAADLLQVVTNQAQFGCRDGSGERIAGMLVAGVNPLLALLAKLPDAAAVEIARVGLSAVLPLMAWRGSSLESHSVLIASMMCLLLLMNGAFPIMPKHGGKIVTEVLLLLDRIDKDTAYLSENNADFPHDSNDYISATVSVKVALFCGAVSLIVCGKSAEDVVQHINSMSLEKPIDRCREICELTNKLQP